MSGYCPTGLPPQSQIGEFVLGKWHNPGEHGPYPQERCLVFGDHVISHHGNFSKSLLESVGVAVEEIPPEELDAEISKLFAEGYQEIPDPHPNSDILPVIQREIDAWKQPPSSLNDTPVDTIERESSFIPTEDGFKEVCSLVTECESLSLRDKFTDSQFVFRPCVPEIFPQSPSEKLGYVRFRRD